MPRKLRRAWPEAKKLCRLNGSDIEMARRLGFHPESLIGAIPGPDQKWKAPVKYWIHDLYAQRFGSVLGEKSVPSPLPATPVDEEEATRRVEEEMFWEDYHDRNSDMPVKFQAAPAILPFTPKARPVPPVRHRPDPDIIDGDVPF
jgi:hypothetical protein